jgi:hypothetical protein
LADFFYTNRDPNKQEVLFSRPIQWYQSGRTVPERVIWKIREVSLKMIKAATRLLLKVVNLLNLTVAAVTRCQLTESQVNDRLLRFRQGLNLSREK